LGIVNERLIAILPSNLPFLQVCSFPYSCSSNGGRLGWGSQLHLGDTLRVRKHGARRRQGADMTSVIPQGHFWPCETSWIHPFSICRRISYWRLNHAAAVFRIPTLPPKCNLWRAPEFLI